MMLKSDTYNVNAPIGGFGNHVRTLLLLSDKFHLRYNNKIIAHKFDKKLKKIKILCYPSQKTWHNWLYYEWKTREHFSAEILFSHDFDFIKNNKNTFAKIIALIINPELCYRCYLKINSNLNNTLRKTFIDHIESSNRKTLELAQQDSRVLPIEASHLFSPMLDREFYNSIIHWFDVEDRYETACELHETWYNLHIKSEQEFVQHVNEFYGKVSPK